MNREELRKLSPEELNKWFCDNVLVQELINDKCRYTLRIGTESRCLVADSVEDLQGKLDTILKASWGCDYV